MQTTGAPPTGMARRAWAFGPPAAVGFAVEMAGPSRPYVPATRGDCQSFRRGRLCARMIPRRHRIRWRNGPRPQGVTAHNTLS